MTTEPRQGLEGVVAAATRLSRVDGLSGRLTIAGYEVEELAPRATVEEVAHLLWYGSLPNAQELDALRADLAARRCPPAATLALLREAAKRASPVMDALRMAASTLSLGQNGSVEDDARTLVATFPAIVGAYWRLLHGQDRLSRERICHTRNTASIRSLERKSGPSVLAQSKRISTRFAITASTRRPSPLASSSPPTPISCQPLRVPSEH